jgi:hypothetical protein
MTTPFRMVKQLFQPAQLVKSFYWSCEPGQHVKDFTGEFSTKEENISSTEWNMTLKETIYDAIVSLEQIDSNYVVVCADESKIREALETLLETSVGKNNKNSCMGELFCNPLTRLFAAKNFRKDKIVIANEGNVEKIATVTILGL